MGTSDVRASIAIALEISKVVYALQKYDFLVLFPINPVMLAKYRQAFVPSQAKDDPTDAELDSSCSLVTPSGSNLFNPKAPRCAGWLT